MVTPTNEGRKLDVLRRRLYSLASFIMRVFDYQAAIGAYQSQLWHKILLSLQAAPKDIRATVISTHLEAIMLANTTSSHWFLSSLLDAMCG